MTTLEKPPSKNSSENSKIQSPVNSPSALASFTAFSGPIPPPEFLKQYEFLVPGIAKRFLEEPLSEAKHRRALEQKMVDEKIRLSRKGQWMAFSLALLSIIAAFIAIFLGYSLAGLGTFFISSASFAGVFIYAKKRQG